MSLMAAFESIGNMEISSVQSLTAALSRIAGCGIILISTENDTAPVIIQNISCCCDIKSCIYCRKGMGTESASGSVPAQVEVTLANGTVISEASEPVDCISVHRYAGQQSQRFGGKYIYFCPASLIFCVSPVITVSGLEYVLAAGPISVNGIDERELEGEKGCQGECIPMMNAEKISDLSQLLFVTAGHIGGTDYQKLTANEEKAGQQQQINEYIQNIKTRLLLERQSYITYPYDKEKRLFHAIITGNLAEARSYLNEILGHIFFSSANNIDTIKVRAMELAVMISRAALDGGADANHIFNLNMAFITRFFQLSTIEDVCFALTELLKKFSQETFNFEHVRHVDLLSKAVSYIKTNYMNKLRLEDVAAYVYLSPSYFSKIFKEEMKQHFNDYLNNIRIEKSKVLLISEKISIIEIAELVGFFDQSYFNKVFKKMTGVTPKKYRELNGQIVPSVRVVDEAPEIH